MLNLYGYTDVWTARSGDTLPIRVSSAYPSYYARVVRHARAIRSPADWSDCQRVEGAAPKGPIAGCVKPIPFGSCFTVKPDHKPQTPIAVIFDVFPSLLSDKSILLEIRLGDQPVQLGVSQDGRLYSPQSRTIGAEKLRLHHWTRVAIHVDTREGALSVALQASGSEVTDIRFALNEPLFGAIEQLTLGGISSDGRAVGRFDGKMTSPTLLAEVRSPREALQNCGRILGRWSFGASAQAGFDVPDELENLAAGQLINAPLREVTGPNWSGRHNSSAASAADYDAVAFHKDDLSDAGWSADFEVTLPADLETAAYSVVLSRDEHPQWDDRTSFDALPLFVVGSQATDRRVALVLPTFSYRAYANSTFFDGRDEDVFKLSRETVSRPIYETANALGLRSLYDAHPDGSGTRLASLKRPQLTIRADFISQLQGFAHQYSADLEIVEWLHRHDIEFDLLTDEVLHEIGASALMPYDVVLTGSHPEYTSPEVYDAWQDYQDADGGICYLGGNGFYWSVAIGKQDPALIEVRRRGGGRTWRLPVGELHHQLDGRQGGTWRILDRPPNVLLGVGFTTTGFVGDGRYTIDPEIIDALPEELRKAMACVGEQPFGVAGLELDSFDPELGSDRNLVVVAHSVNLPDGYHPTPEEIDATDCLLPDPQSAFRKMAGGTIVWGQTRGKGHVFSVGSIRWTSGLNKPGDPYFVDLVTTAALQDLLTISNGKRTN